MSLDLKSLGAMFRRLRLGASGVGLLLTPRGLVVAASDERFVRHTTFGHSASDRDAAAESHHELPMLMHPLLMECGLLTDRPVDNFNASCVLTAKDTDVCERSVRYRDDDYLLQARLLSQADTALPWTVVIVTRNYDFYGSQLEWASVQLILATTGALLVAIVLVSVAARLLTRPIDAVVVFMADVARIAAMPASDSKQAQMKEVQQRWHALTGAVPPRPAGRKERQLCPASPGRRVGDASTLPADNGAAMVACSAAPVRRPFWFSLQMREVIVMQRSFSELLRAWSGYDELEALNRSKRQFIRYIFHEVCAHTARSPQPAAAAPRSLIALFHRIAAAAYQPAFRA